MRVDEVSDDGEGLPYVKGQGGGTCSRLCHSRVEAMGKSMGRMEEMLGLLMAVNGLVGSRESLAAEKHWGRMACE